MPRGDKSSYTDKQKRQAEHIEESEKAEGRGEEAAERIAWATVNKQDGGGRKQPAKTAAKKKSSAAKTTARRRLQRKRQQRSPQQKRPRRTPGRVGSQTTAATGTTHVDAWT